MITYIIMLKHTLDPKHHVPHSKLQSSPLTPPAVWRSKLAEPKALGLEDESVECSENIEVLISC